MRALGARLNHWGYALDLGGFAKILSFRLLWGAVASVFAIIGGTFGVLQLTIGGLTTAVDTTNGRIESLDRNLNGRIDDAAASVIALMEKQNEVVLLNLQREFELTRKEINLTKTGLAEGDMAFKAVAMKSGVQLWIPVNQASPTMYASVKHEGDYGRWLQSAISKFPQLADPTEIVMAVAIPDTQIDSQSAGATEESVAYAAGLNLEEVTATMNSTFKDCYSMVKFNDKTYQVDILDSSSVLITSNGPVCLSD